MAKKVTLKVDLEGIGKAGEVVSLKNADAKKLLESGSAEDVADDTAKVALLADCHAGKAGAVVELPAAVADALVAAGAADDNEAAVAYRERENAPKQDPDKALS